MIDFNHYLEAARLILQGASPYGSVEFFAPPWMALVLIPYLILPQNLSALAWVVTSALANGGAAIYSLPWLQHPHPGRVQLAAILLIAGLAPASLFSYVTGQISPLVGLGVLMAAGEIATRRFRAAPIVTGLLLATLKPHIVALPALLCLLELLRRRQFKLLLWLGLALLALAAFAFLNNSNWLPQMVQAWQSGDYRGGRPGLVSPGYISLGNFGIQPWMLSIFALYTLWIWFRQGLTAWVAALAFSAGLLCIPYNRSYDYVILILPLMVLLFSGQPTPRLPLLLGLVSIFVLPLTPLTLLTPVGTTLGLLWLPVAYQPRGKREVKAASSF